MHTPARKELHNNCVDFVNACEAKKSPEERTRRTKQERSPIEEKRMLSFRLASQTWIELAGHSTHKTYTHAPSGAL